MVNNSTNINKTNYHLSSYLTELNTKKGTGKYDFEIQILALDRHKKVAQWNQWMPYYNQGLPTPDDKMHIMPELFRECGLFFSSFYLREISIQNLIVHFVCNLGLKKHKNEKETH